jgi:hypothetical protein
MGLYDNYKQTNSTLVESFAGSTVPELTKMKEQLDNRYEMAQEKISGLNDMLVEAPILEADKQNWVNINNEAQAKLGELSKRKDLENTVLDVHLYSAKVANKLKSLALQKKTRDEYYATVDKMDLPNDIKDMYKQESDQNYGGLKFDEYGKAVNSYVGGTPTKNVDTPEKIRKALQILVSSGDVQSYTQDSKDGMYTIQTTNGVERRTANEVLGAMRSARALDSEWQASDNQAIRAQVFKNTKNVTDEVVQQFLNKDATDSGTQLKQQEIKRLVEQGIPLKEAWKTIQTEQATKDNIDASERYALGNVYSKTSKTVVEQEGPEAKDQRQRNMIDYTQESQYKYDMKKAEETAKLTAASPSKDPDANTLRFVGETAVLNVSNWAPTIKDLQENGIDVKSKELTDLSTTLKTKEAQLAGTTDERARTTLNAEISDTKNKIRVTAHNVEMLRTINKQALDETARELGGKNVTTFESLVQSSLPTIRKKLAEVPKWTKPVEAIGPDGKKYTLSPDQIAEAVANGNVEPYTNAKYTQNGVWQTAGSLSKPLEIGTMLKVNGKLYAIQENGGNLRGFKSIYRNVYESLVDENKLLTVKVKEKAKEKSTKNFSIRDVAVTMTKDELETVNAGEEILGFVANDGTTPQAKPVGFDPTKTTRNGSITEMTGLIGVTYRSTDGTVLATGYNTTSGTQIKAAIGRRMQKSNDSEISARGKNWVFESEEDVRYLMPGNRIETQLDGSPVKYWNGKTSVPVAIDINMSGTGTVVDKTTGQVVVINGTKMENQPVSTLQQILTASKFQK